MFILKDFREFELKSTLRVKGGERATTWTDNKGGSGTDTNYSGHDANGKWFNYTKFSDGSCYDYTTRGAC